MRRLATLLAAALMMVLVAPAALAQSAEGQVTVIHGVPGLTVDVYVNGDLTLEGFEPGDVAGPLSLPAGDYDLAVTAAGASIDDAVLTATATVTDGINASVVAHLAEDGTPTLSIFANDTSAIDAGNGRLVVRHTAAAPTVDILLADGTVLFAGVSNPNEAAADVPAGTYDVEIAPAGAGVEGSVFSVPGVEVPEGTARIVYATGSLADGSFGLVVQDITGLGSAPAAVNTGGEPAGTNPALIVALALLAVAAIGLTPIALRRSS